MDVEITKLAPVYAPKLLSDSSFSLLHISNTTEMVEVRDSCFVLKLNDVRLPGSIVNFKPGKCPFEVKYERVKELNKLAVMSFLEDFVKEPGRKYLKIAGIGADCCELALVYKKVTLWKGLFKTVELQSKVGEIKEVASNFKQLYEKTAT